MMKIILSGIPATLDYMCLLSESLVHEGNLNLGMADPTRNNGKLEYRGVITK